MKSYIYYYWICKEMIHGGDFPLQNPATLSCSPFSPLGFWMKHQFISMPRLHLAAVRNCAFSAHFNSYRIIFLFKTSFAIHYIFSPSRSCIFKSPAQFWTAKGMKWGEGVYNCMNIFFHKRKKLIALPQRVKLPFKGHLPSKGQIIKIFIISGDSQLFFFFF